MKAPISPSDAFALILEHLPEVPAIDCPLTKCAGRVLRETVKADRPFPPFNRAMMDGYAIRAEEIGQTASFTITAQAPAGAPPVQLGKAPGVCVEIMTGAVVPEDANCIVPYEQTERTGENRIRLLDQQAHQRGDCIHPLGSDRPSGEILLAPGCRIGSREIAVAASCGYNSLRVAKMPAISIISTGDELVDVAQKPKPYQIRRSNDIAIETALARVHLHARDRIPLPDDSEASEFELGHPLHDSDFLLISGGISQGKRDYIPEVLSKLGLTCHFHGVAQKPGKPFGYWSHAHCGVFTLPGNPLSALTCLHHYVIPAIQKAMGIVRLPTIPKVCLNTTARGHDHLTLFLPVALTENNHVQPRPAHNSGDLVNILSSDGYIELPPATESYPKGSTFVFHPWH